MKPNDPEAAIVPSLWRLGMFQRYDVVVVCAFIVTVLSGTVASIAARSIVYIAWAIGVSLLLLTCWLISLVYRTIWFVIKLNSDIDHMPIAAAKIAVKSLTSTL